MKKIFISQCQLVFLPAAVKTTIDNRKLNICNKQGTSVQINARKNIDLFREPIVATRRNKSTLAHIQLCLGWCEISQLLQCQHFIRSAVADQLLLVQKVLNGSGI